ncbi:hypothetical protein [Streptomyces yangpuensis]|uniref:terpene synthase family protein n=1 Tax=Streptomyces yangpuensis TaxID=1648182 RepID=UPI0037210B17
MPSAVRSDLTVADLGSGPCPGPVVTTLPISYPAHWMSPVRLSSFAGTIEDRTIAWMAALGLVPSPAVAEEIRAMEPRHYGGYALSLASHEYALAFCQYVTMWLRWDDEVVENATSVSQVLPPLLALAGIEVGQAHRGDPYVRAFGYLGDEYERLGASRLWRITFADTMRDWAVQAVREENLRRSTTGADRTVEETLALRVVTIGLLPTTMTLERAVGIELTGSLRADPDYRALVDQASRIVCIVNDLVAVGKDLQHGQEASNTVLCDRRNHGHGLRDAYEALIDVHDQSIDAYDHLASRLLGRADTDFRERLAALLAQLRYMCSGFALWHTTAARYRRYLAVEAGRAFQPSIVTTASKPDPRTAA